MLINILWPSLDANKDGGHIWQTGSIFSCSKGLWDCLPTKPITTIAIMAYVGHILGTCQWISLAVVVLPLLVGC